MRCLLAVMPVAATLLFGCSLYPDKSGGDDSGSGCETANVAPIVAVDQLINPQTLECQSFSEAPVCDPACGEACPDTDVGLEIPDWGSCASACRQLDEVDCEASPMCRVALNYDAYYAIGAQGSASGYTTDFMGCYPIDTGPVTPASCQGLAADACATNSACAVLYESEDCGNVTCGPQFKQCIPAKQAAGSCGGQTACDLAIDCPANTTPGVSGLCYTGSCIPDDFCGYAL